MGYPVYDHICDTLIGHGWRVFEIGDPSYAGWTERPEDDPENPERNHTYDDATVEAAIRADYEHRRQTETNPWEYYNVARDGHFTPDVYEAALYQNRQLGGM